MSKGYWLMVAAVVITAGVILAALGTQAAECTTDGGAYVRGLFWYSCVGGDR